MKTDEPKMVQYLDRLTYVEQAIICNQVRTQSHEQRYAHLHPGLLPFISVKVVKHCLFRGKVVRTIAAIISKLELTLNNTEFEVVTLAPKKVIRIFGTHLGSRVFGSLPGRPTVRLSWVADGIGMATYKVHVEKKHQAAVVMWLIDNCI